MGDDNNLGDLDTAREPRPRARGILLARRWLLDHAQGKDPRNGKRRFTSALDIVYHDDPAAYLKILRSFLPAEKQTRNRSETTIAGSIDIRAIVAELNKLPAAERAALRDSVTPADQTLSEPIVTSDLAEPDPR